MCVYSLSCGSIPYGVGFLMCGSYLQGDYGERKQVSVICQHFWKTRVLFRES